MRKPVDFRAGLLAAGFKPSMLKRCELLAKPDEGRI